MSFFSKIASKIFGHKDNAAPVSDTGTASGTPASPAPAPAAAPQTPAAPPPPAASAPAAPGGAQATPSTASPVDVAAVLDAAVASHGQKLDWRKSIVDLLKALDIDSSLAARKELAKELGYTGNSDDSATMNIWLHKQVLQKLKDNGGKVPADLVS